MGKKILPPTLGAIITLFFDANHGNPLEEGKDIIWRRTEDSFLPLFA